MTEDNDNDPQTSKIRLFPILLGITAVLFLNFLTYYRNWCAVSASLANFAFSLWLFLFLITAVNQLIKLKLNKLRLFKKFKSFFVNNKTAPAASQETDKTQLPDEQRDSGLLEIKKENILQPQQESINLEKRIYEILYIISFLGIVFWRITVIIKRIIPLFSAEDYRLGITDAVLLLILPCVCILYLKIRKNSRPTDKISRDLLAFFSYISFVYAAVIAASAVFQINFQVVLQWVFYTASFYLIISLAVNILLSMLKGDILSFDYSLFPEKIFSKEQFAQSAANWKVSIKSLYTIRYTLKILPALALGLIFTLFLSTGIFVVQPHQQAAVYHFGGLKPSSIKDAGLHIKFPFPIDKAEIYDVHRAASMQIGYEASEGVNFLWTQKHDGGEYMLLLGNGNEMAAVNLKIMYVISDLYSYVKTCANAEAVLSAAAYNALMTRTINTTLDSFLNVDRNSLSASVLEELSQFCRAEKLGFNVIQVVIENIHPPVDIADVYQKVVSADIEKTTAITRAKTYAEIKVIEAAKLSKYAIDRARAMQYDRTSEAQKETAVFYAATDADRISPSSYQLTKTLETYEKIIKGHKVYVFSRGAENGISKSIIGKVNTVNLLDANKGEGNE